MDQEAKNKASILLIDTAMRAIADIGATRLGRHYLSTVGLGVTETSDLISSANSYVKKFENYARREYGEKHERIIVEQNQHVDLFLQTALLISSETIEGATAVEFRLHSDAGLLKLEVTKVEK